MEIRLESAVSSFASTKHILKTGFDVNSNGVPINEADMIVTQLAFSYSVLLGIDKIGIR